MIWVLNEKRSLFEIKRKMKRMSYAQCKPRHPKIKSLKERRSDKNNISEKSYKSGKESVLWLREILI